MQRVNEFNLYDLGLKIHRLSELPNTAKFSEFWFILWEARTALSGICDLRPLSVTLAAANNLRDAITEVVPDKIQEIAVNLPSDVTQEEPLHPWNIQKIKDGTTEFETILAAECQVLDTYLISKKGAFSTADLIANAHHHIPESTRKEVPKQTKADFDQAGKALAFDLPTAAAFHLLRGTEAVLREYYDLAVPGNKKAPAKMRNWGVYIRLLAQHGADAKVVSLLTHLKDAYRNPVFHPEENYIDDSVQVLLGVCVSAIAMMVVEVKKLKGTSGTLNFPATNYLATGTGTT